MTNTYVPLEIRALQNGENLRVGDMTYRYQKELINSIDLLNPMLHVVVGLYGFAVQEIGKFHRIWCFVVGSPGHYYLFYVHQNKGLLREKIVLPRLALNRIREIIEENRC